VSTETAENLREFWLDVLELDSLEPTDTVLDLGGDSLIATMIANRIELSWGFRPTMEEMLTLTFLELSALCTQRRAA
jgi:acyl carrier protein